MRSAIAVAALVATVGLAGCPTQKQPTCDVETQVEADVFGRGTSTRCEVSAGDAGDEGAAWTGAQTCVLDALAAHSAFTFVYDTEGGQAGLSGYFATNNRPVVRQYAFTVEPTDPTHPRLSVRSCQGVEATAGCQPTVGKPCLGCVTPSPGTLLCGK